MGKAGPTPAIATSTVASSPPPAGVKVELEELLGEMRDIQAEVTNLREQLDELRVRVEKLEG